MRTTIRLPETLLREAKKFAAETNRSLTSFIEEAVRTALAGRKMKGARRVRLPTGGSGGVRPGVDLDRVASLHEVMEGGVEASTVWRGACDRR